MDQVEEIKYVDVRAPLSKRCTAYIILTAIPETVQEIKALHQLVSFIAGSYGMWDSNDGKVQHKRSEGARFQKLTCSLHPESERDVMNRCRACLRQPKKRQNNNGHLTT